jgi:hypothetical protein
MPLDEQDPEPITPLAISEAPRPQGGASRKGNTLLIVPLDPAYKAGLAGTCRSHKTLAIMFLKKAIDDVRGKRYTAGNGKPDQVSDFRKEA